MNRNRILTISGILLSCMLACVGFFLMQELLLQKQEKVLSQTGIVPAVAEEWKRVESPSKSELSQEELMLVLTNMESSADEEPHEPFGQQLSMKEAIDIGIEWLEEFYIKYVVNVKYQELGTYEKATATLCKKEFGTEQHDLSEELFSYWTVKYNVKDMKAELILNAVTGQVLRVKLSDVSDELGESNLLSINEEELLIGYAKAFSMDTNLLVKRGERTIVLWAEGSEMNVILRRNTILINHQVDRTLKTLEARNTLELYLSTELQIIDNYDTTDTQIFDNPLL